MNDVEVPTDPIRSIWLIPTAWRGQASSTYRTYMNRKVAARQAKKIGAQVLRIDLWLNKPPTVEWEDID